MASSPRRLTKSNGDAPDSSSIVTTQENELTTGQCLERFDSRESMDQKEALHFLNKIQTIRYALETDVLACDAKWTLFVAAALSYRYDTVLKPIPFLYTKEQTGFDINALATTINDTPKLRVILRNILEQSLSEISVDVIELLHWVIVILREPAFRLIDAEELNSILKPINENAVNTNPTHVFEVNSLTGYHSEVAFRHRVGNLPIKKAFMGNKLDTYFSILQNGFSHLPENKEYIELTTDLASSIKQSPDCAAWGASQCGSIISCTAICEFAFDANCDKMVTNKNDKSSLDIHIKNPQNIRIRYLLFYGKRIPKRLPPKRRLLAWLYRHKYSLSLLSYLLLLISIGFANSGNGERFKLYITQKFDDLLEFCRRIITREPLNQ